MLVGKLSIFLAFQPYIHKAPKLRKLNNKKGGQPNVIKANAWTDIKIPERTINVPNKDKINVRIASNIDQWR